MFLNSLNGSTFRITTRYNNLYTYDVIVARGSNSSYTFQGGYAVEVFYILQFYLGFSYVFVPDVGPYNFSLAGTRDIDVFVGSYSLHCGRVKLVDPTFVTGHSRIIAFLNHEHEINLRDAFCLPFRPWMWVMIFLFVFICFFAVWSFQRTEWTSAFCTTLAVLLQKECAYQFHGNRALRITLLTISAYIIVLSGSYTGNMFSIKAVNRFSINSEYALAFDSHYRILLELGDPQSTIHTLFENLLHIPVIKQLFSYINAANYRYSTFEAAFEEVKKHPTAYIIDEETGMSVIQKQLGKFPCTWAGLSILNLKYPWVMYMKKRSPYKNAINYALLRMQESGIRRRLWRKYLPHVEHCQMSSMPFFAVQWRQIHTPLSIYIVGVLISLISYIVFERNNIRLAKILQRRKWLAYSYLD